MRYDTIKAIVEEALPLLRGQFLGKIFQLSTFSFALDFGTRRGGYVFISVEPARPRLYLINRTVRQLEKQSQPHGPFAQAMRANIGGAKLVSITTHPSERIVRFLFSQQDETGVEKEITLLAQLTGRSANLFILGSDDLIIHALRTPHGAGQQPGETYEPPRSQLKVGADKDDFSRGDFATLSAAVDDYFSRLEASESFSHRVRVARERLLRGLRQREKLKTNLYKDIENHGDPDNHKRLGDLLLANISSGERVGGVVRIQDFFADGEPVIELAIDEGTSLQQEAARYFARYSKSKRAKEEIENRLAQLEKETVAIQHELDSLSKIESLRDETALVAFEEKASPKAAAKNKKERTAKLPGVRRYLSSDGYEVLVGRAARTNDSLTFKVARPHDMWLHAADYPGSHVIVRNTSRKEIPHRTIIEAAQLAARFSQAGEDTRVNVNYAERKFISKPKGAAPGLVRMASFRTIIVAPGENIERLEN